MTAASPFRVSYEDYVLGECSGEAGDTKHEWSDGVVYAMSRGSIEHARLVMSIGFALRNVVGEGCVVYGSEAMLFIERAHLSTYADVSVVCGPVERQIARDKNGRSIGEAITNPRVLVEVLSDSTERYDRDGKFQAYKQIAALDEYVLVSQHEPFLEVYRRRGGDWTCETAGPGGAVTVQGAAVAVDDVYRA